MVTGTRRRSLGQALATLFAVVVLACTSQPPPPPSASVAPSVAPTVAPTSALSPSPSATPEASPPPKVVGSLALEACDPAFQLPCAPQSVVLSRDIVGTGIALSVSTEWAQGRLDRPQWDAGALGLGAWSLDVLQRYDPENGVLLSGDGSWRIVQAVALSNGERAVPSFDARQVFVFDSEWHHVRTLDDITGAALLTFSYDAEGRLASAEGSVDSDPVHLRVTHNSGGRSIQLLGVAGAETVISMDDRGDLVSITASTGAALLITPGSWGLIHSWQNVGGQPTTYTYDGAGRLASSTDPDGVATQFERTDVANGFEVHVDDGSRSAHHGAPRNGCRTRRSDR